MNFTVGVYDLFAYAIPGAAYLTVGGYIARRAGWQQAHHLPRATLATSLAFIALAYFVGQAVYRPAQLLDRQVLRRRASTDARTEFRARHSALSKRAFVDADMYLLLAAIHRDCPDNAAEVERFRAVGIGLRNVSPALGIGTFAALYDLVSGYGPRAASLSILVVLALATTSAQLGGNRLSRWAYSTTLEAAALIPGIDDVCRGRQPSGTVARHSSARLDDADPPSA